MRLQTKISPEMREAIRQAAFKRNMTEGAWVREHLTDALQKEQIGTYYISADAIKKKLGNIKGGK